MDFFLFLNHGLRIAGFLQWCVFLFWLHRNRRPDLQTWLLTGLGLGVLGYCLAFLALTLSTPTWLQVLIYFFMFAAPVFLWFSANALFRDGFRLRTWHIAALILSEAACLVTYWASPFSAPFYSHFLEAPGIARVLKVLFPQFSTYVFLTLALAEARRGMREDLIEERILLRKRFVQATSVVAFLIATADVYTKFDRTMLHPLNAITAACILALGYRLSHYFSQPPRERSEVPGRKVPPPNGAAVRPAPDTSFEPEFQRLIEIERVYMRPSLDIEQLADLLKIPEYRLRNYINKQLGFRNFNQFLNHHRVNAARRILDGETHERISVYNLAMDLGYGSVVSFNRAFKEATGSTPSEYRLRNPESGK